MKNFLIDKPNYKGSDSRFEIDMRSGHKQKSHRLPLEVKYSLARRVTMQQFHEDVVNHSILKKHYGIFNTENHNTTHNMLQQYNN